MTDINESAERIARSMERIADGLEKLVPIAGRLADSLGRMKDVVNKTIGQGELDNIAGAIIARPFKTTDKDGEERFVHGMAVLDAVEDAEGAEEEDDS